MPNITLQIPNPDAQLLQLYTTQLLRILGGGVALTLAIFFIIRYRKNTKRITEIQNMKQTLLLQTQQQHKKKSTPRKVGHLEKVFSTNVSLDKKFPKDIKDSNNSF